MLFDFFLQVQDQFEIKLNIWRRTTAEPLLSGILGVCATADMINTTPAVIDKLFIVITDSDLQDDQTHARTAVSVVHESSTDAMNVDVAAVSTVLNDGEDNDSNQRVTKRQRA